MIHNHSFDVEGKTFNIESGRVANQAGGAVLLGVGDTVILATATMSAEPREGIDFMPLVCDYEERKYAVGKIAGGFVKRGGRPSEKAVLTSRLIDRPVRPLFPKGLRNDVQVIATPLAVDQDCPPDVLAICAAGAALAVSDVPFKGAVAGVRVGRIDGKLILFPTGKELLESDLDLVVAGHKDAISMVEAGASEVTEEVMIEALALAKNAITRICTEVEAFARIAGKPKRQPPLFVVDEELVARIKQESAQEIEQAVCDPNKQARESAQDELLKELVAKYGTEYEDQPDILAQLPEAVDQAIKKTVRTLILEKDQRPDGRKPKDIRRLEAVAGLLPRVHGSGLFTRGQTQVLTVLTLGMPSDAQILDGLEEYETEKRYMHFYNFPPYSVGEVRPLRAAGRREIGHGALAERALKAVVPLDDPDFPYTLLLISEVLESNGSTSMASVCGSTLALMDAGVPIKAPVAGIAMGLMSDGTKYKVLTDIQGVEDFCGDMDFKVAGTRDGITALQLDTKLEGIPESVLADALAQAKEARLRILDVITAEIPRPRAELAPTAPRVTTIQINPEKIGAVIGPGGSVIRKITTETGAQIDIQQDGRVLIASTNGESAAAAIEAIRALTATAEVGAEFRGKVTRLMGRGAMVEYLPGKEGLVPLEWLTTKPVRRPDDVVQVGDEINVRVHEIDAMGRVNLTALGLPQDLPSLAENGAAETPKAPFGGGGGRDRGGPGGRDRGGRDRDRGDRGGRDRGRGRHERGARPDDRASGESFRTAAVQPQTGEVPAIEVPDQFPKRQRSDAEEPVNARFRPRR
jgi:polyribonucleotide nucleotidyltransferase